MKVTRKLTLGFGVVIILSVILSAVAIWSAWSIDSRYTHLLEYPQQRLEALLRANIEFTTAKYALSHMSVFSGLDGSEAPINGQLSVIDQAIRNTGHEMDNYIYLVQTDGEYTENGKKERKAVADAIKTLTARWYNEVALPIAQANLEGRRQDVVALSIQCAPISNNLFSSVDYLVTMTQDFAESMREATTIAADRSMYILAGISLAIILISMGFAAIISAGIVRPLSDLTTFMTNARSIGDISLWEEDIKIIDKHSLVKDEIGQCIGSSAKFIKYIMELQRILERHNLSLKGEVDQKTKAVFELQNTILKTVAELVECRDNVTGGHIARTQYYLGLLIKFLLEHGIYAEEVSTWDADLFVLSSQLHDVGKISIKDDILMKPGKLTDEEFEEMKKHTVYGVDIVRRIAENTCENSFLSHAKMLAGSHHEKWDGTGYPLGLEGSAIPLQGRLMAIIDVYDALTNDRQYKKAVTHEQALEIIKDGIGTHFDPLIGAVFLMHERAFHIGEPEKTLMVCDVKPESNENLSSILKVLANVIGARCGLEGGQAVRMRGCLEAFVNILLKNERHKEEVTCWDRELFLMLSQLHDIGKIAVADTILNKTEKLTETEYQDIKTHVEFGVKVIQRMKESMGNSSLLDHAEAMVSSHHEKWDGTGYPLGLKQEKIPLQGRVMAIVDVYTALTAERPYRKKYSHSEAVGIIRNGSGTHFDPELVDMFMECEKNLEEPY